MFWKATNALRNKMADTATDVIGTLKTPTRQRKHGFEYFRYVIGPHCRELIDEIEISYTDAEKIYSSFIKMDIDGSGLINSREFIRFMEFKRAPFTERIFDLYADASTDDEHTSELDFSEFLICVWNYCSYDADLICHYLWSIFDLDKNNFLTLDEIDAMMRFVYYNNQQESTCNAMNKIRHAAQGSSVLTFDAFKSLIVADNSLIQPAFDVQSRLIQKTTGSKSLVDGRPCWEIYCERRRAKYDALPDFKLTNGKIISSGDQYEGYGTIAD